MRIDEVIFNSMYQVKIKYPGRKIVSKIQYPENEDDLIINGNEGLLSIAFRNLLENACKFSEDDVRTELSITDKHLIITITDSGIGIPSDEIERIYRPFSRASNAKYISGFGIGLSLVTRIVELHKAVIDIQSKVDAGTKIKIIFSHYGDKLIMM
ncbi:MAG: ATP-binding protein [Ignavibacteriales bacterium]|nr:ATP-binding protein [Ignavibacteriales bacterium]